MRSFEGEQIGRAFVTAGTVFARGIVPELVSGRFSKEVGFGRKDLSIEQFGFDGVVDAFDIGIGIGTGRRIEAMFGLVFLLDGGVETAELVMNGIPIELAAQIGGDDHLGSIQAVVFKVFEKTIGGEGGIGFGEFIAIGQELGAARQLPDGVLETGQAVGLHLRPVKGDVGQVFDIHLEAGEGGIGSFNGAQIVFALVPALGFAGELVLAENAIESVVTHLQTEFCDEAARPKARGFAAQRHGLSFELRGSLMRAGSRGPALGDESLVAVGLETAEPFARGMAGTLEGGGGGLDAMLEGMSDEVVAQREFRIVGADHGVIRLGGGRRRTRLIEHALVSPEVRHRCPSFSILGEKPFSAPRAPWPPFPPGGPRGARPLASPEPGATTLLTHSKSVERYIEFSAAGKPAEGGHDVPGPRR